MLGQIFVDVSLIYVLLLALALLLSLLRIACIWFQEKAPKKFIREFSIIR